MPDVIDMIFSSSDIFSRRLIYTYIGIDFLRLPSFHIYFIIAIIFIRHICFLLKESYRHFFLFFFDIIFFKALHNEPSSFLFSLLAFLAFFDISSSYSPLLFCFWRYIIERHYMLFTLAFIIIYYFLLSLLLITMPCFLYFRYCYTLHAHFLHQRYRAFHRHIEAFFLYFCLPFFIYSLVHFSFEMMNHYIFLLFLSLRFLVRPDAVVFRRYITYMILRYNREVERRTQTLLFVIILFFIEIHTFTCWHRALRVLFVLLFFSWHL